MKMNRRNVIVGLGAIVTAGGGALATGAFSTVEAERSVSVDTTGDSDAFLALGPNESSSYSEFIESDGENQVDIDIGRIGDEGMLNQNALSAFDEVLQITNNAEEVTAVEVTIDAGDGVEFYVGEYDSGDLGVESLEIANTESENVGIVVDLRENGDEPDIGGPMGEEDVTVTITANRADSP